MPLTKELLSQSILFCRFAAAAYLDRDPKGEVGLTGKKADKTPKLTCDQRFNPESTGNTTDTEALVCYWNNDIVIAFRGTEPTFKDIFTDMNGVLTPNTDAAWGGQLHSGFQAAANSVYEPIVRYVKQLQESDDGVTRRIFVCGHSLGGALAVITASRLLKDSRVKCRIAGIFTYGAPRVGDEAFAAAYQKTPLKEVTHMWVSVKDPVARVAPVAMEYRHVIPEQHVLEGGNTEMKNLDKEAKDAIEKSWIPKVGFKAIQVGAILLNAWNSMDPKEHSVEASYLQQLEKLKV